MISYRTSNLFDSIKKQIPFRSGDILKPISPTKMDWNGWEINPDRPYNVSHITENGLVVVQNGFLSSDFAKLTLEDAKLLFEKIGESNLYGFKVGDMVCPEYVRGVRQTEKTCYYLNKILVNAAGKAFGFFTKDNNNDAKKFDSYCELSKLQKQGGSVQ